MEIEIINKSIKEAGVTELKRGIYRATFGSSFNQERIIVVPGYGDKVLIIDSLGNVQSNTKTGVFDVYTDITEIKELKIEYKTE